TVELLSGHELYECVLDRVLQVVVQLGIALAGEGEPLPPEHRQHLAEQRVRRRGPRGAQDCEDRFWPPVQHLGPARGCPTGERSVKALRHLRRGERVTQSMCYDASGIDGPLARL